MMHAVQYTYPGSLKYTANALLQPSADEVLIKVAFSGICGTDLHIIAGEAPSAKQIILGHEFSGIVAEIGDNVTNLNPGDAVSVNPNDFCGQCPACKQGSMHFCQEMKPIGISKNGGWAEYCSAPVSQVHKLPDDVPREWGALCEPLSCIVHGWDRLQPLVNHSSVLILGSGLIGLLWALTLRQYGFQDILISEPLNQRRIIADKLNFSSVVPEKIADIVVKHNNGFDVIIDCSGNAQAIEAGFAHINPLGKFLLFGICPPTHMINISPFQIFQKELSILGSVINPDTFSRAVELIGQIARPLEDLGVTFYPLPEYEGALRSAREGKFSKVIFRID